MFIRIKKIKKFEYAYKVKNVWSKKGTRQKVKGYLGRVYKFEKTKDIAFPDFISKIKKIKNVNEYIKKSKFNDIVLDLVKWEFFRHGFNVTNSKYRNKKIILEIKDNSIFNKKKEVVLMINDGFLCGETIKNLLNFKAKEEEEEIGIDLANVFVGAGIGIEKDVFVKLFEKYFHAL